LGAARYSSSSCWKQRNKAADSICRDALWAQHSCKHNVGASYLHLKTCPAACRLYRCHLLSCKQPFEFLATAASTGVMTMALAWVLFDFTDSPPPGGNFSSPRK
jgi:hypothetical protein